MALDQGAPCPVVFYETLSGWQAATTGDQLRVTFDEPSWPVNEVLTGVWTLNGVSFEGLAGAPVPNIWVFAGATPFGTGQWLVANGDELIDITPESPVRAMAFDAASNTLGPAYVTVYGASGELLGQLTIPVDTVRFVGITAGAGIGRVRFSSVLGALKDTGFDNVRIADAPGEGSADLNLDGVVNGADLGVLLAQWGACADCPCVADLNSDGTVDGADLGLLLSDWTVG